MQTLHSTVPGVLLHVPVRRHRAGLLRHRGRDFRPGHPLRAPSTGGVRRVDGSAAHAGRLQDEVRGRRGVLRR